MSIRKAAALAAARILSRSAQEDASKPLRQLVCFRETSAVTVSSLCINMSLRNPKALSQLSYSQDAWR